ncbi:probable glycosyltransferase At5g20260 isoform X2 [Jatropha curcas]|uniref:probable glycosyltransferase At5g20260 isoform X2 n=1 Tax=Jatropha curcas TaxID=180498 RepID=UPI0009D6ADE2|nr:probable glycosyltransferase At5g20260 isoform X2 [Jatropha curcas]
MAAESSHIHIILLTILCFYLVCSMKNNNIINYNNISNFLSSLFRPVISINKTQQAFPSPNPILPLNNTKTPLHVVKKKGSLEKIENGLARARAAIRQAVEKRNYSSFKEESYIPRGVVYRNSYAFHQSHIEMEKRLKVWVYKEGEPPLFHGGPTHEIYGIEGQFIHEMENGKNRFIARHPDEAHTFLIPISITNVISYVYTPLVTYSRDQLQRLAVDYIRIIADKYPYWNRSNGGDHFFVSCHDWAPEISTKNPELFKNFIRVLCNANTSESFQPQRDASVPEIRLPRGKLGLPYKGLPPSNRTILAFFAGGSHGYIRQVMLEYWKDKDDEIQIHGYLDKKKTDYYKLMGQSKFCLCPSGYEVASPRVVAAIQLGCVPVIISENYSLPFSDVLDWSKFSVHIPSKRIPEIKEILKKISERKYLVLQKRVMQVQRHFMVNKPIKPYDMIHMLLHSVWLRRLNLRLSN